MRIDRFLSDMGIASRRESAAAAKRGQITVDGVVVRDPSKHIDPERVSLTYMGRVISYQKYVYVMLNKPDGYISATDDPRQKTVLELLDDRLKKRGLFPCGRLDIDTLGLLILTDDGQTAHRLISPKHHAEKVYKFGCANELSDDDISRLENGVDLDDGYHTLPAKVRYEGEKTGYITLTEGKYHQIKRMFAAVGNKITYLERVSFGGVILDESLERGEYRYLTEDEKKLLLDHN